MLKQNRIMVLHVPLKGAKNHSVYGMAVIAAMVFAKSPAMAQLVGFDGWTPKFYHGLEANGNVTSVADGYKGDAPCIELRHIDGAQKFGAEKLVKSEIAGPVEWRVAADVWCGEGGEAGVSMEFFGAKGGTLGMVDGDGVRVRGWTRREWRFDAPASAASASVHILSLATGAVRFANIRIASAKGTAKNEIELSAKPLPSAWNRDWNGGRDEFTSFVGAPLPMVFHFKGDRAKLKKPAFEIDVPDDLEVIDAFTEHAGAYRAEKPTKRTAIVRDGIACTRLRFEDINVFKMLQPTYGWERKLALLIGLKSGRKGKKYRLAWRLADGERAKADSGIAMRFVDLPKGLRKPKDFTILSWQCDDLVFSADAALEAAIPAYEAAGLTWFRRMNSTFKRGKEVERWLAARPTGWRFTFGFADLWDPKFLGSGSDAFKALDVKYAEFDDGKPSKRSLCPDYFNNDAAFGKYYRDNVLLAGLKRAGVQAGDLVTSDFEPWGSQHYCVCERCRKAFAKHQGLAEAPSVAELKKYPAEWAEFRCTQTEETLRQFFQTIREYNPGLVLCDYDYVLLYGTKHEKVFVTGCAKDTRRNEKWFDLHICSYYHTCGLKSFEAIRNNTRHLKKPYLPLGAVGGYGGYLRAGEVRHPRQIRMLALAAAAHGCPGVGFYQGIHYDGEHLLAFMKARDEIAAVERFQWGKREGALKAISDNAQCVCAASVSDDGAEEIAAIFNYDDKAAAKVKVHASAKGAYRVTDPVSGKVLAERIDGAEGFALAVKPEDVRFVVFRKFDFKAKAKEK